MRIYQDVFTEDEYMSEMYKFELECEDVIMKVGSSYKNKDKVGTVDVGCGNAFGGGDDDEGGNDEGPQEKVLDVQHNFNLVEVPLSKADFKDYIKGYMKQLKEHLAKVKPERVEQFQKGAMEFVKKVMGAKFEEYTFYTGAKETLDGGIALSFWENEEAAGPMFYFFNDGLKSIKY